MPTLKPNRSDDIARQITSLYGEHDWRKATGVLHVAAIEATTRAVLAIGPQAPRSATDRFVLGFARARADVLVTTGAILRAEPELVHRYAEDPVTERAFRSWRARVLGKSVPASLIVLSRSGDLPPEHPALEAADSGFVWTSDSGRERLGPSVHRLSVEIAARSKRSNGLVDVLEAARDLCPFDTALIEAGPETTRSLYESTQPATRRAGRGSDRGEAISSDASAIGVDELLLSQFEGRAAARAIGPPFVSEAAVASCFTQPPSSVRVEEASGPWRFERYRDELGD